MEISHRACHFHEQVYPHKPWINGTSLNSILSPVSKLNPKGQGRRLFWVGRQRPMGKVRRTEIREERHNRGAETKLRRRKSINLIKINQSINALLSTDDNIIIQRG